MLAALLPSDAPGNLPYWMLFVSGLAVFNSVQNFLTTKLTRRVYSKAGGSVNALQARTFGVWTLMSAAVRISAAYNIGNKAMYDLALISYVLALGHFASEFLVFRTAGLVGVASPFVVATTSLTWMIQRACPSYAFGA
ncbi:hypothetical protein JCM11641_002093, partial [Rhodosporidiobolus odoratus]